MKTDRWETIDRAYLHIQNNSERWARRLNRQMRPLHQVAWESRRKIDEKKSWSTIKISDEVFAMIGHVHMTQALSWLLVSVSRWAEQLDFCLIENSISLTFLLSHT